MRINKNLFTLKCVLFAFFAGVGCLFPFLPLHMLAVGLRRDEARIISIVAPFVAMLGPAIAGPLSDKLSVGRGSAGGNNTGGGSGRILQIMIAGCFLLGAFFYLLLLAVPVAERHEVRRPNVSFTCHSHGAVVFQEICSEDRTCNRWSDVKSGPLVLDRCEYACDSTPELAAAAAAALAAWGSDTTEYPVTIPSRLSTLPEPAEGGGDNYTDEGYDEPMRARREDEEEADARESPAPHLCHYPREGDGICQVYTNGTKQMTIQVALQSGADNVSDHAEWCAFPSAEEFRCKVPEEEAAALQELHNNSCIPVVRCRVLDPYDIPGGVLAQSPCQLIVGDPAATFWIYLVLSCNASAVRFPYGSHRFVVNSRKTFFRGVVLLIFGTIVIIFQKFPMQGSFVLTRSIADIFPTAALGLLGAACVVATRETSRGRGDVGRQYAFGSIALAIFPPLAGLAARDLTDLQPYLLPFLMFATFMLIGALILLLDGNMPLSPPEWWWHTANGTLAMPMNTVRRYGTEIAGLFAVMVLLGILWSGLDSYLPWMLKDLKADSLDVSVTLVVGILPAIPALWWAETVVDYIGHSNLLITAFTMYAVRYTGMGLIDHHSWALILEALEVFTLSLVWVTAILYFRHLVPRKYTSSGQALPVLAHFGIGRCVGAVVGGMVVSTDPMVSARDIYNGLAVASIIVAALYLALYHLLLAPSCAAPPTPPDQALLQGLNTNGNTNGSYSPVRVYHEERGRKAQFRY